MRETPAFAGMTERGRSSSSALAQSDDISWFVVLLRRREPRLFPRLHGETWWKRGGFSVVPPRRRPGSNWGTVVTGGSASLLRLSQLGPGLRRGGSSLLGARAQSPPNPSCQRRVYPHQFREEALVRRPQRVERDDVAERCFSSIGRHLSQPCSPAKAGAQSGSPPSRGNILFFKLVPCPEGQPPRRRPGSSWGAAMMSAVLRYLGLPNWAPAFAGVALVGAGSCKQR